MTSDQTSASSAMQQTLHEGAPHASSSLAQEPSNMKALEMGGRWAPEWLNAAFCKAAAVKLIGCC